MVKYKPPSSVKLFESDTPAYCTQSHLRRNEGINKGNEWIANRSVSSGYCSWKHHWSLKKKSFIVLKGSWIQTGDVESDKGGIIRSFRL